MRPLLALLLIAVLALVGWVMLAVMPGGSTGEGQLELRPSGVDESVGLPAVDQEKLVEGSSRELLQADRVIEYRLVDAATGEGLAGAEIYKVKTGELVVRCDDEGVAHSTEPDPGQLYYHAKDYLLGFFLVDRKQLTKLRAEAGKGTVRVPLYRDVLTFPLELRFVLPDGELVEEVGCTIGMRDYVKRTANFNLELARRSAELEQAWKNHRAASVRHGGVLLGAPLMDQPGEKWLPGRRIQLCATGVYGFHAAAAGGYFGAKAQWIDRNTGLLELTLSKGSAFSGQVVDRETGEPIAEAQVKFRHGSPEIMFSGASTDVQGRFQVHAAGGSAEWLLISHPMYWGVSREGVAPGSELNISMRPFPLWDLQGRLAAGVDGVPLSGAKLDVNERTVVTDEEGRFLFTGLPEKSGLTVLARAEGYRGVRWAIECREEEQWFYMAAKDPDQRVAEGTTGMLSGRVMYSDGSPAPSLVVGITVDEGERSEGSSAALKEVKRERAPKTYEFDVGGRLVTPSYVHTDSTGSFTIEFGRPGLARVSTSDKHASSTTLQVQLGKHYNDITLTTNR